MFYQCETEDMIGVKFLFGFLVFFLLTSAIGLEPYSVQNAINLQSTDETNCSIYILVNMSLKFECVIIVYLNSLINHESF